MRARRTLCIAGLLAEGDHKSRMPRNREAAGAAHCNRFVHRIESVRDGGDAGRERRKLVSSEVFGLAEPRFAVCRTTPEFNTESQRKERSMSTLVVVGYDDPYKAEEVRLKLLKMQRDYLIDMEDAVFAVKDKNGKVKLHQAVNLTAAGALSGGFWGSLIGLIFLNPLLGMAVGAAAGAVSGALTDVGINDQFMKDLAATLKPNSSVLFVLVRNMTEDKVLEELSGTGGKVLKSSLSHENEARLQAALSKAKA
jgi:uncharacterized membrane protein